jgi:hypothetical protein
VTWSFNIYNTQSGAHALTLPEPSAGEWNTRLSGKGRGRHAFPLYGAGVSRADIREFTTGNKYTITQEWGTHVVYAGVIQRPTYTKKTRTLEVASGELRGAYLNDRMLFGVDAYLPNDPILTVSGRSHSGAARAVLGLATSTPGFALPIDLPADGSGGFSADWLHSERLKVEDHLQQVEDDGCEIYLRPYKSGSALRFETVVGSPGVQIGSATSIDLAGDDSPVLDLQVYTDYVKQMTGVLAFGTGGASAPTAYAPLSGYPGGIGIRDTWMTFSDISDVTRLQDAANNTYAFLHVPTEVMSFGLHVYPGGPAFAAPGRLLEVTSTGDEYILDGPYTKRVVGLRGDLGLTVTPEVQDAS